MRTARFRYGWASNNEAEYLLGVRNRASEQTAAGELVAEVFYEGDRLALRVVGECDLPADEIAEIIRLAREKLALPHDNA